MSESRFSWAQLWWRLFQKPLLYVLALSSGLAVPTLTVCASLDRSYLQPCLSHPALFSSQSPRGLGSRTGTRLFPALP